jgi:hypothetical protein
MLLTFLVLMLVRKYNDKRDHELDHEDFGQPIHIDDSIGDLGTYKKLLKVNFKYF